MKAILLDDNQAVDVLRIIEAVRDALRADTTEVVGGPERAKRGARMIRTEALDEIRDRLRRLDDGLSPGWESGIEIRSVDKDGLQ